MDIQPDVLRFCKSHNWYRSLPWKGKEYLMFPWKGQQPRSTLDLKVEDPENLHWWFWDADSIDEIPINGIGKDIIMRRPIRFNCFLRGFDGTPENRYFAGVGVIRVKFPKVDEELMQKHKFYKNQDISFLAHMEHIEQVENAVNIGSQIYELFKSKCPGWLNINLASSTKRLTLPSNIGFSSGPSGKYQRYQSPHPLKRFTSDIIRPRRKISNQDLTKLDFIDLRKEMIID